MFCKYFIDKFNRKRKSHFFVWTNLPTRGITPSPFGHSPCQGSNLSTTSWSPSPIRKEICSLIGELAERSKDWGVAFEQQKIFSAVLTNLPLPPLYQEGNCVRITPLIKGVSDLSEGGFVNKKKSNLAVALFSYFRHYKDSLYDSSIEFAVVIAVAAHG